MLSRTEVGLSGTTFLDPSEVLLLGELMLLAGSSARMECKYFVAYILLRFGEKTNYRSLMEIVQCFVYFKGLLMDFKDSCGNTCLNK